MPPLNRREMIGWTATAGLQAARIGTSGPRPGRAAAEARRVRDPARLPARARDDPAFWVSTYADVGRFLETQVRKGTITAFGRSAGGRPIRAVVYGRPRTGKGTTTFSGSLGYGDVRAWVGPDYARKVYLAMASFDGGEFEGIVGIVTDLGARTSRTSGGGPGPGSRPRRRPRPDHPDPDPERRRAVPLPIRMGVHRGRRPRPSRSISTRVAIPTGRSSAGPTARSSSRSTSRRRSSRANTPTTPG